MFHELQATPSTVHWGYFDAGLKPALRIKSGDIIRAEAVTHQAGDAPELMMDDAVRLLYSSIPEDDRNPGVHLMTGPIYVEDAQPGDMLEVRYLQMRPRFRYGSNLAAHWGLLYKEMGEKERVTIYKLDPDYNTARALYAYNFPGKYTVPGKITKRGTCNCEPALNGVRVPVRPHLGTAGVAPDAMGRVSTVPPGAHGGNIDNWRIGAGATMYYPVAVPGALFSIGDPHISQGDGEISGTAIEASLNVIFQIVLRKDFHFPSPLLETPDTWIVHGFDDDLDVAMKNAAKDMLHLLVDKHNLSQDDAYSLMSISSDFGVTQVVDGRQGVHCKMQRGIFPPKDTDEEI
ncbi:acetamidase/formamidase family protein [Klebsiella quasipneumoniae subsp. similipneumoniae]|jgi:formamidase|uniref:acetamidase/formamidase family protein n=1 Tax=Klebsiella quasipneumoniae TaxID=1463165 RepID=UPI0010D56ABC|nr:acetamidase/formamidase family protein [Klebsiella quasipneumoniae]UDC48947.1 acetamidase/formamidase family protein [Klebsiella quasipneumoniae subsp. similipneumoniae]VGP34081.1 Formamidase [Klebsiella quasipneumoniae subsp. similipneumoniae]